ncbi:MAG: hypothetical protein ACKO1H_07295, partial [Tabrizicola sp.]
MTDTAMFTFVLRTAVCAIASFGAAELLTDREKRSVAWALALFLGIAAFDGLVSLDGLWRLAPQADWICGLELLLTVLYGPALYFYVLSVTGTAPTARRIGICVAGTLGLAVVLLSLFLTLPPSVRLDLQLGAAIGDTRQAELAGIVAWVMRVSFLLVTVGFLVASWVALDGNLRRLRGLFSSLDGRNLTWLRGVMILIVMGSGW